MEYLLSPANSVLFFACLRLGTGYNPVVDGTIHEMGTCQLGLR